MKINTSNRKVSWLMLHILKITQYCRQLNGGGGHVPCIFYVKLSRNKP
jgi:hypothetical protein